MDLCQYCGSLLVSYNYRALTQPLDKLPALSGLARFFQNHLQDRYVFGMWEKTLHRELAWTTADGHHASLDSFLLWHEHLGSPYITPT